MPSYIKIKESPFSSFFMISKTPFYIKYSVVYLSLGNHIWLCVNSAHTHWRAEKTFNGSNWKKFYFSQTQLTELLLQLIQFSG